MSEFYGNCFGQKTRSLCLKAKAEISVLKLYGRMDGMRFYFRFNSISVLSGQWMSDNERQFAMEPRL